MMDGNVKEQTGVSGDVVIRAEGLGKSYVIGHDSSSTRYSTLRETLGHSIASLGRTTRDMLRGRPLVAGDTTEEFWALRGVDFEIRRGDIVGIIGRNGAGKSTLLKILSRITEPTEGRVTIKGRVASLLEVGTGFHPELTGRENIYLNGAILGMSRAEIRAKFDEIVAFAEIERFLDTPVKRYSSGMYVRLAFAVAAHLEPEILIVDEVLAVGDAEFQKKCLGKMKDEASRGRTVLFVSHNLAVIKSLTSRCLLMDKGHLQLDVSSDLAVDTYLNRVERTETDLSVIKERAGNGRAKLVSFNMRDASGRSVSQPACGQETIFELRTTELPSCRRYKGSVQISTMDQVPLILFSSELNDRYNYTPPSATALACRVPRLPLPPGNYLVSLYLELDGVVADWLEHNITLTVAPGCFFSSDLNVPVNWKQPVVLVEHEWPAKLPAQNA